MRESSDLELITTGARSPVATCQIIAFPSGRNSGDDRKTGGGNSHGVRRNPAHLDLVATVVLMALVLTPRVWIGAPLQLGLVYSVVAGLIGLFIALVALETLSGRYRCAVHFCFLAIIAGAIHLPELTAPAIVCALVTLARGSMR